MKNTRFFVFLFSIFLVLTACNAPVSEEGETTQESSQSSDSETKVIEIDATQNTETVTERPEINLPDSAYWQGVVHYTVERNIEDEINQQMKGQAKMLAALMPKTVTQELEMTIYDNLAWMEEKVDAGAMGGVQIKTQSANHLIDAAQRLDITVTEMGDQTYAVPSKTTGYGESKEGNKTILGYECVKSIVTIEGKEATAWVAPKIPVAHSPFGNLGTKAIILGIESEKIKAEATSIEEGPVDKNLFEIKEDWKFVTEQQLEDITRTMLDQLGGNVQVQTIGE